MQLCGVQLIAVELERPVAVCCAQKAEQMLLDKFLQLSARLITSHDTLVHLE